MASSFQQATRNRKLIYFGAIAVLFGITIFARGVVALPLSGLKDSVGKYTIRSQAHELELTEYEALDQSDEMQRDAELTGSAVRLLLTGSRGFAICVLWMSAHEKQVKQEWNELELTVKSITTLQPHFVTPWLFQSWNLSYNVSVEMDRLNDMYFYISRGINLLAEGEAINRYNPDMRYAIAFYYQNKFTVSDKVTTLRSLLQLSCMPGDDRNPDKLMRGGELDEAAFKEFCEKYPQFVRRLREGVIRVGKKQERGRQEDKIMHLAETREEVVRFLRENQKLPSRYSKDDARRLETRLKQFPVVPPLTPSRDDKVKANEDWGDAQATALLAARAWFKYANEAVPPPNPIPGPTQFDYRDPERKRRVPRQPMLIIFRQGPPRAQSFIAEQLSKDGWFDNDKWIVDEGLTSGDKRWFSTSVEITPSANSREAWQDAHTMWRDHGRDNGLILDLARFQEIAKRYANKRHFPIPTNVMTTEIPAPRPDELQDERMKESIDANIALSFYYRNLQVTNFESFLNQADAEMDPLTVKARKYAYQADRLKRFGSVKDAIAKYEQILGTESEWKNFEDNKDNERLIWARVLLNHRKFAEGDKSQEDTFDMQLRYLSLVQVSDEPKFRRETLLGYLALVRNASPVGIVLSENHLPGLSTHFVPSWPVGPFDGINKATNAPWIGTMVRHRGMLNAGLTTQKQESQAPALGPENPVSKK